MRLRTFLTIALALSALGSECGVTTPDLSETGTVRRLNVEGGCWVIEATNITYEPINLPQSMRQNGLRVTFEAEIRDDVPSICQVGVVIELLRILPAEG